jgi:hypothetical protein
VATEGVAVVAAEDGVGTEGAVVLAVGVIAGAGADEVAAVGRGRA